MISSGMNLVMTVIGFAVSIMFIVFVCTRLICARIHLNSSRRSFPIASRSDLSLLERGLHGVESVVVANFPTKKFSDEYFAAVEDTQYVPLLILTVTNVWFRHFLFHLVFQFKLKILGLPVLNLASICIPFPRLVFNQVWKMCMGKSIILW